MLANTVRAGDLDWVWEDRFTARETRQLSEWLTRTHAALERYAGDMPFDIRLHIHRYDEGTEPVPWANTWRDGEQSLHFYVNPAFSLNEFLDDWTAPHEFSHLLLPYLGRENVWFAEGFASHLQFEIMVEMGVIGAAEASKRREKRAKRALDVLSNESRPLPDNVRSLRARGSYASVYWGGAVYFERVEAGLATTGQSLRSVLIDYLQCCRMRRRSLPNLARTLDRLSESNLFTSELELMYNAPGVPARPKP